MIQNMDLVYKRYLFFKKTLKNDRFEKKIQCIKVPGSYIVNTRLILFEEAVQWWFPFEKSTKSVAFTKTFND